MIDQLLEGGGEGRSEGTERKEQPERSDQSEAALVLGKQPNLTYWQTQPQSTSTKTRTRKARERS